MAAAPVPLARRPGKIVCVGFNYPLHAREIDEPVPSEPTIFLKAPSAVVGSGDAVARPPDVGRVDYEGEIGLVVGRRCRRAKEVDALDFVGGVAAVNDVTAREMQATDRQWARSKSLDTFCPVGDVVRAARVDFDDLSVETRVDGRVRQTGATSELAFSIPFLVSFVSHMMTLEAGDLILTGTPAGVGPLLPGDVVEVELSCGSRVTNPVVEAPALGFGG